MTVIELRRLLATYPPDVDVFLWVDDGAGMGLATSIDPTIERGVWINSRTAEIDATRGAL